MNAADRFWERVTPAGECLIWTGGLFRNGYGSLYVNGRAVKAHRFAYELLVRPVPAGMQLDHLCRNRACVAPSHLQPVTQRENILRGRSFSAINARKTHCDRGHDLSLTGRRTSVGGRACRVCEAIVHGCKWPLASGGAK